MPKKTLISLLGITTTCAITTCAILALAWHVLMPTYSLIAYDGNTGLTHIMDHSLRISDCADAWGKAREAWGSNIGWYCHKE